MKVSFRSCVPLLVILFLSVLFYWQIGCMQDTLKWDALDAFLPWRRAVTESLRSGHLPFWNPYQYLGFPIHSDPECGAWYPVVWLLALFGNYDFYSQNAEFCMHIFIAGYGTYKLSKSLGLEDTAAMLCGICFMSCGFFVGTAQNFIFLIGAAWFPWALCYIREAFTKNSWKAALKSALVLFMILSGSYPGMTIIAFYCLFAFVLFYLISNKSNWPSFVFWKRTGRIALLIAGMTLLCSAVVLVSVYEALPYFSRSGAIPYELICENPFPAKAFISFLLPFAGAGTEGSIWGSGICMVNAYVGLIPILLLADWIFSSGKSKREWVLFGAGCLLMGIAMGATLPLRYWLYLSLPGMNLFRHPAIFRAFALLAFILVSGARLNRILKEKESRFKKLFIGIAVALLLFVCAIIKTWPAAPGLTLETFFKEFFHYPIHSILGVHDRIFVQSLIQCFILFIFALVLYAKKQPFRLLSLIVVLDMFLSVQLNMNSTVAFASASTSFGKRESALLRVAGKKDGYNNQPISENEPGRLGIRVEGLWRNMNMLCKQPYFEGYNSFQFIQFNKYESSGFYKAGMKNRLVYLSDTCYAQELMEDSLKVRYRNINLYSNQCIPGKAGATRFEGRLSNGDTVTSIAIQGNEIRASVCVKEKAILTLMQNDHKNWSVWVDGKNRTSDIFRSNHTLMSIVLEKGSHEIRYCYFSEKSVVALIVSLTAILLSIILLLFSKENLLRNPAPE
jgi:hypothetical protein